MSGNKIMVVDDEPDITELITLYLERDGFDVYQADNGEDALRLAQSVKPDLIILDIQMKRLDGIEVCKRIRIESGVPILFVSAMSDDTDIIHGLEVGGDDYITKPFSPSQLVARVKAHLRRHQGNGWNRQVQQDEVLSLGGLTIDIPARTVHIQEAEISLSVKEFDLLLCLAQAPNRTFPLDELYALVWGADSMGDTRTLMVHISNLRKKVEPDPANPQFIVTVRGVGYKFHYKEGTSHVYR
ncbi:DNA-binding response OmpR family regulator [Paenibacillus phyllosphaerae]|uniref:DNA-binding response OmpR family regulator n=1 Tax=Paenibacillus phyllosphaerae TaxID=274593 RepID=A0A7W5AYE3_9BACL|nr:response regulator transcription factor [Paenibacillus phyllosphaerae]MBB3110421.1 DNA-binding response OmpR family regulator [Paenibacillus phyllosphaerae]